MQAAPAISQPVQQVTRGGDHWACLFLAIQSKTLQNVTATDIDTELQARQLFHSRAAVQLNSYKIGLAGLLTLAVVRDCPNGLQLMHAAVQAEFQRTGRKLWQLQPTHWVSALCSEHTIGTSVRVRTCHCPQVLTTCVEAALRWHVSLVGAI